jgi:hypothetical protein
MQNFNVPTPLKLKGNISENWRKFYQQFTIFLDAAGLGSKESERKIAILLNTVGDEALEIYNTFTLTNEDQKDYENVITAFKDYCNPRKNIIYQRYLFYIRDQKDHESFDEFYADIKKLVKECEFKDDDEMLRDRIVLGINNMELQERLVKMDTLDLTKALESCRIAEITRNQIKQMHQRNNNNTSTHAGSSNLLVDATNVHFIKQQKQQQRHQSNEQGNNKNFKNYQSYDT